MIRMVNFMMYIFCHNKESVIKRVGKFVIYFWRKIITKMFKIKNENVLLKKISKSYLDDSLMNSLSFIKEA